MLGKKKWPAGAMDRPGSLKRGRKPMIGKPVPAGSLAKAVAKKRKAQPFQGNSK
jgi:hypothetical protein